MATVIYVAVALGVFGTLTVDRGHRLGGTALAVAAEPVLGSAGYWLMTVTALFATAGATNAGLYPAAGLCERDGRRCAVPTGDGSSSRSDVPVGLVVTAAVAIVLAVGFDLSAIASIGSAIALLVFGLISVGHLRVHRETGANPVLLVAAVAVVVLVLAAFVMTTLIYEPATMITLGVIVIGSVVLDGAWKHARAGRMAGGQPAPGG